MSNVNTILTGGRGGEGECGRAHPRDHAQDAQLDKGHGERRRVQCDPAAHLRVRGGDQLVRGRDHAALGGDVPECGAQCRGAGGGQRGQGRQDADGRRHSQHHRQHSECHGGQAGDSGGAGEDCVACDLCHHTEWNDR